MSDTSPPRGAWNDAIDIPDGPTYEVLKVLPLPETKYVELLLRLIDAGDSRWPDAPGLKWTTMRTDHRLAVVGAQIVYPMKQIERRRP